MKRDPAPADTSALPWPVPHPFGNERLWLDSLIEREILRLRARYELSLDELRGLYISDRQVDELLRRHAQQLGAGRDTQDPVLSLTRQAAQWRAHFAADSPLALLGERLALSEADLELVFVVLAPELDLRYETLYAYLNNDIGRKSATPDMAQRLLDDEETRSRIVSLLGSGILITHDAEDRRSSLCHCLALALPVTQFLLGVPPHSRRSHACHCAEEPLLQAIPCAGPRAAAEDQLVVCRGDDNERLAEWTTQWLIAHGRHGLHVSPEALLAGDDAFLIAQLGAAALVLHDQTGATRDPPSTERLARSLQHLRDQGQGVIWLVRRRWQPDAHAARLQPTVFDLSPCTLQERAAVWAESLRQAFFYDDDSEIEEMAIALASRFSLDGTRIKLAVRGAQASLDASASREDCRAALEHSARQLGSGNLAQVAQRATKPHRWPQLVLANTTMQLLREIACAIGARERVFREWNMQGRTGRSAGLMMLFAGASGTGKTMAASVLANHVGLELYRIDLASVISKYIGETEKNLDRIFTTAQDADAILLFDEADALLGKRSEVKDAHDRYANIEVAYLLQKMEEHDGVVILASNLPKNLDQAFSRRMHYVVEFSRPNAALREQLWLGMFPAEVPLAGDIDYSFLGEQFDLTGGDIQTIALEAAFLAAGESKRLGMTQLMRAIARRQTKHGDPGVAARYRTYLDTLEQGRA